MSSKKCYLRQHIRGEAANLKLIDLSLDDTVLKYVLHGPSLSESHIDECFEIFDIDEPIPNSGSSAILHTQNGFALLQALSSDICVESLGRNFDGGSAHSGIKVRPCTTDHVSTVQLLPGQSFYLGISTLSLVPQEYGSLPLTASGLPDSEFESYNNQVSQIGTLQRSARMDYNIMETPMLHGDHESEHCTPILEQITGQAVSGSKDTKKCPGSPLKRKIMQTVRGGSEDGLSSSQPEFKKKEQVAREANSEPDRSSLQPQIKTEEEDTANATAARPFEQRKVDLEDVDADLDSENVEPLSSENSGVHTGETRGSGHSLVLEESKPWSSPNVEGRLAEESGASRGSPILAGSNPLSSSVVRVEPARGTEGLDRSPSLQTIAPVSPQIDDDHLDTRVRKKARTAAASNKALTEGTHNSLQKEVISINIRIPAQTNRPIFADQTPSTFAAPANDRSCSRSTIQAMHKSATPSTGSKHLDRDIDSDARPHSASQRPSFKKPGPNPHHVRNITSTSPSKSAEPSSSMSSTRSTARERRKRLSPTDDGMRIVFASSSSAGNSKPFLKFLSRKGVEVVHSVHDCTVLCVGKELKKMSKFILAVVLGKDIVTDRWVIDSVQGDNLLGLVPYMPRDVKTEGDWGISLDQAIYRGKQGLKVLQDQTILFAPSAKKELGKSGFDELKEIIKCAGAKGVSSALPKRSPGETLSSTVVVATQGGSEVAELQKLGWRV